jgi:hypothetical protein
MDAGFSADDQAQIGFNSLSAKVRTQKPYLKAWKGLRALPVAYNSQDPW